jgi:hypothetical protein
MLRPGLGTFAVILPFVLDTEWLSEWHVCAGSFYRSDWPLPGPEAFETGAARFFARGIVSVDCHLDIPTYTHVRMCRVCTVILGTTFRTSTSQSLRATSDRGTWDLTVVFPPWGHGALIRLRVRHHKAKM